MVYCDHDSGYHCQLEISTFTFIFIQMRTEVFFKICWERWLTINPHSLVLMNLNQALPSRQRGLPKSFGDYFSAIKKAGMAGAGGGRDSRGQIEDLYARVVASDFKPKAISWE